MPKIYVTNFNPSDIVHKWSGLDPYYMKKTSSDMIYSDEGVYTIKNNKLFRLYPIDMPLQVIDGGFTLDNSHFVEKMVDSQVPYDHIRIKKDLLHFCVGKRSGIHLIVEGTYTRNVTNVGSILTQHIDDKYYKFIPSDMYFVTEEKNIDNKLFIQEVNILLSIIR